MNKPICRSISVVLFIVANALGGGAQQSPGGKTVPSLSSDGVVTRRSVNSAELGWKRYSPEGFGLSFELPGEPFERPYPVSPELQSQIVDSKVLDYLEDGLTVNIAHIVFGPSSLELGSGECSAQARRGTDRFGRVSPCNVPAADDPTFGACDCDTDYRRSVAAA